MKRMFTRAFLLLGFFGLLIGGAHEAEAVDTTAPSIPTALVATAISSSQINLSWTASTDDVGVVGYQVYRNGLLVASQNGTSFSDIWLPASSIFSYTVTAFDAGGNSSAQSGSVSQMTRFESPPSPGDDTAPPSTPTNLTATAVSTTQINLSWTASTDNIAVAGYRVYRDGTLLIGLGNVTSYQNTSLIPATSHSYTVQAMDTRNASGQSTPASATTQAPPDTTAPATPTGLTATAISTTQINLTWSASTDNIGVTGYKIYRGGTLVATLGNVTSYQNTGLTASTLYTYTVSALDAAANESGQSASASATTQAVAQPLTGDLNLDHIVNSLDWSIMNMKWFTADATADLNNDGLVNAIDLSLLNMNWLKTW